MHPALTDLQQRLEDGLTSPYDALSEAYQLGLQMGQVHREENHEALKSAALRATAALQGCLDAMVNLGQAGRQIAQARSKQCKTLTDMVFKLCR